MKICYDVIVNLVKIIEQDNPAITRMVLLYDGPSKIN